MAPRGNESKGRRLYATDVETANDSVCEQLVELLAVQRLQDALAPRAQALAREPEHDLAHFEHRADVQRELGMTEGFDVMFEMSGNADALRAGIGQMAHGGRIAILGIPTAAVELDLDPVIFNMLTLKGIYGREMFETWYKMVAMLQSGLDLSPMITHRFPVDDYERAFATMLSGQSGKVVLDWST